MTHTPPDLPPAPPIPPPTRQTLVSACIAQMPIRLALFLLVGIWFLGPWLSEPNTIGLAGHDWTYFTHHAAAGWRSFADYGQLPEWNPYFCGGIPALGNLQSDVLSPDFALTGVFGFEAGLRLRILLMLILGMEGAYRYARDHGTLPLGAVVGGILFATSGRFTQIFVDGQPAFFGFELVPWILLGLERAYDRPRWAILGGAAIAWMFLHGGAVATPCAVIVAGLIATRDMVVRAVVPPRGEPRWDHVWRPYRALVLVGIIAVGLTAIRLLPVVESVLAHPRLWRPDESYSVGHVLAMLLEHPTSNGYVAPGTSYVGVWAAVALLAAVLAHDRKAILYLATLLLTIDLAMGNAGPLGVWKLVHALPVLEDFRNPFRFTFVGALFLALGAARGLHLLERALASDDVATRWTRWRDGWRGGWRRWVFADRVRVAIAALVALAAALVLTSDGPTANQNRLSAVPRRDMGHWAEGPFRQSVGNRWFASIWPRANLGSLSCFEEQPFLTSPQLRGDLDQEEYFARGEGRVTRLYWSPHVIELAIDSPSGGRIFVNQNWHRAWQSDVGAVVADDGLLAIDVPAGAHVLRLTFADPLVRAGGGVSAATLVGIAGFFWWRRRRAAGRAAGTSST